MWQPFRKTIQSVNGWWKNQQLKRPSVVSEPSTQTPIFPFSQNQQNQVHYSEQSSFFMFAASAKMSVGKDRIHLASQLTPVLQRNMTNLHPHWRWLIWNAQSFGSFFHKQGSGGGCKASSRYAKNSRSDRWLGESGWREKASKIEREDVEWSGYFIVEQRNDSSDWHFKLVC